MATIMLGAAGVFADTPFHSNAMDGHPNFPTLVNIDEEDPIDPVEAAFRHDLMQEEDNAMLVAIEEINLNNNEPLAIENEFALPLTLNPSFSVLINSVMNSPMP